MAPHAWTSGAITSPTRMAASIGIRNLRSMSVSLYGLLDALHLDLGRVGVCLAADGQVLHLPGERVRIDGGEDRRGGHRRSVAGRHRALDGPHLAVLGPLPLAESAVQLERPGSNLLGGRVVADPLRAAADRDVLERRREG